MAGGSFVADGSVAAVLAGGGFTAEAAEAAKAAVTVVVGLLVSRLLAGLTWNVHLHRVFGHAEIPFWNKGDPGIDSQGVRIGRMVKE